MVRAYVGPEFDFDVQPILKAEDVPWCRLGKNGASPRLRWNTWLHNQPFPHDADDAVFVNEGSPTK
jgi:type VI secretion system protein ImpH